MHRFARGYLIVISIVNGLSGLVCGILFLVQPDGSLLQAGALLPVIRTLPLASVFFEDFTWIGIAMLLVLGIPNCVAVVMLLRHSEWQYLTTLAAGVLLLLWTGFELVFMFNAPAVGYFIVGILSVVASVLLLRQTTDARAQKAPRRRSA